MVVINTTWDMAFASSATGSPVLPDAVLSLPRHAHVSECTWQRRCSIGQCEGCPNVNYEAGSELDAHTHSMSGCVACTSAMSQQLASATGVKSEAVAHVQKWLLCVHHKHVYMVSATTPLKHQVAVSQ